MARWKRVEKAPATGFVGQLRDLGHNYPHFADRLERDGTLNMLGYTLWSKFGEPYREHMHHFRCTVDTDGNVIGTCSTQDARLFLESENSRTEGLGG